MRSATPSSPWLRPGGPPSADLLWLAVQILLTVLLFALPIEPDPQIVVLAWGAGALVSAIAGCLAVRLTPIITGAASWMADDRARVGSFLGDFVMLSGSNYLAMYLVVAFATVRAVAAVRGSAFLFSPLDALFLGIRIFALPALARAAPPERPPSAGWPNWWPCTRRPSRRSRPWSSSRSRTTSAEP